MTPEQVQLETAIASLRIGVSIIGGLLVILTGLVGFIGKMFWSEVRGLREWRHELTDKMLNPLLGRMATIEEWRRGHDVFSHDAETRMQKQVDEMDGRLRALEQR